MPAAAADRRPSQLATILHAGSRRRRIDGSQRWPLAADDSSRPKPLCGPARFRGGLAFRPGAGFRQGVQP